MKRKSLTLNRNPDAADALLMLLLQGMTGSGFCKWMMQLCTFPSPDSLYFHWAICKTMHKLLEASKL